MARSSAQGAKLADEFLYEKAPLVEVIAEVRWKLIPIATLPAGSGVDPHFSGADEEITKLLAKKGFGAVERLVPPGIPTEFLAGQPVLRFRRKPNVWPLFQFGPGLFTINIAPPYKGWSEFRLMIAEGLNVLFEAYPFADRTLKLASISLRYLDAFTAQHGFNDVHSFLHDLGFGLAIPSGLGAVGASFPTHAAIDLGFDIGKNDRLVVKAAPGLHSNSPALMLELGRYNNEPGIKVDPRSMSGWFDDAHSTLHKAFDAITSGELKQRMGPLVKVS